MGLYLLLMNYKPLIGLWEIENLSLQFHNHWYNQQIPMDIAPVQRPQGKLWSNPNNKKT